MITRAEIEVGFAPQTASAIFRLKGVTAQASNQSLTTTTTPLYHDATTSSSVFQRTSVLVQGPSKIYKRAQTVLVSSYLTKGVFRRAYQNGYAFAEREASHQPLFKQQLSELPIASSDSHSTKRLHQKLKVALSINSRHSPRASRIVTPEVFVSSLIQRRAWKALLDYLSSESGHAQVLAQAAKTQSREYPANNNSRSLELIINEGKQQQPCTYLHEMCAGLNAKPSSTGSKSLDERFLLRALATLIDIHPVSLFIKFGGSTPLHAVLRHYGQNMRYDNACQRQTKVYWSDVLRDAVELMLYKCRYVDLDSMECLSKRSSGVKNAAEMLVLTRNVYGETPLHLAAMHKCPCAVVLSMIRESPSAVFAKTKGGETAIDYAIRRCPRWRCKTSSKPWRHKEEPRADERNTEDLSTIEVFFEATMNTKKDPRSETQPLLERGLFLCDGAQNHRYESMTFHGREPVDPVESREQFVADDRKIRRSQTLYDVYTIRAMDARDDDMSSDKGSQMWTVSLAPETVLDRDLVADDDSLGNGVCFDSFTALCSQENKIKNDYADVVLMLKTSKGSDMRESGCSVHTLSSTENSCASWSETDEEDSDQVILTWFVFGTFRRVFLMILAFSVICSIGFTLEVDGPLWRQMWTKWISIIDFWTGVVEVDIENALLVAFAAGVLTLIRPDN